MGDLSKNFSTKEFACPCCGVCDIQPVVYRNLQALRDATGKPIVITSGYRCSARNNEVGGSKHSSHLFGFAADFLCESDHDRRVFLLAMFGMVDASGGEVFTRIGIYPRHFHVDFDPGKNPAVWVGRYSE